MYVIELIWREAGDVREESDEAHLGRHGVTADEFEEAFWSEPEWRAVGGRSERLIGFGRTSSGRILMMVIEPWENSEGLWSPVTGRAATAREKKRFPRLH